jgi:hypothetical protein
MIMDAIREYFAPVFYLIKIAKEIKAVGFKNWWWFVVVLKRNEFSNKLDIDLSKPFDVGKTMQQRTLAHEIDAIFSNLEKHT